MAKLIGVTTLNMQNGKITKVSYQGEEYTKVDGVAQINDVLLRVKSELIAAKVGCFYIAKNRSGKESCEKYTYYVDHDGDNMCGYAPNFIIYRKSPAAVSPPFAEMITSRIDAVEVDVSSLDKRVSALEVAKEQAGESAKPAPTLNEGDRVKALRDGEFADIEAGEYGTVEDKDFHRFAGDPYAVYVIADDGEYDYFRLQDLELAPEEASKPVVGDIVVITGNTNRSRNTVGDIGKVGEYRGSAGNPVVQVPGDRTGGIYTRYPDMRHATLTEKLDYELAVSDERKKSEADVVFTKAGRKPNEYRKGDVVRYLGNSARKGSLAEVVKDSEGGYVQIEMEPNRFAPKSTESFESVEIVCFAEDRKDNSKGGR